MRRAVSVIACGLTLLCAGATTAAANCQMQELGELPLTVADGRVTLEAQIDGRPVRMTVDTGAEATLLTRPAAEHLGLALRHITGVQFYGVGGMDQADMARVKEFRLANMVLRDFDMVVTGQRDLGDSEGLLGAGFLLQADVEFDLPDQKIRFFKPLNCQGDQVVYWGKAYSVAPMIGEIERRIMVTVLLNGKPTYAQMDTGAPASVVTTDGAANAGVRPTASDGQAAGSMHGLGPHAVDSYDGVFATFGFGDETINNARLRIADLFHDDKEIKMNSHIATAATDEARMLLGADFFSSHRIYVSRGQRKVYVSYVGGPVFARFPPADAAKPAAAAP